LKRLIVTADDFGISKEVNEAVETAHRNGILTATSLMVGEPFADDAVQRARDLPTLGVGLHLALSRAHPVCSPKQIPGLVDRSGLLPAGLVAAGFRFFFRADIRRQLQLEITAQFEAFARTNLALDHVNAHNHLHLHPTVLSLILTIGKKFGMKSIRLPKAELAKGWGAKLLIPWLALMKFRLEKHDIRYNDILLGLDQTGMLDTKTLISMINRLSDHTVELMCHPATGPWPGMDPAASTFRHDQEFLALIDDATVKAVHDNGIKLIAYKDI